MYSYPHHRYRIAGPIQAEFPWCPARSGSWQRAQWAIYTFFSFVRIWCMLHLKRF